MKVRSWSLLIAAILIGVLVLAGAGLWFTRPSNAEVGSFGPSAHLLRLSQTSFTPMSALRGVVSRAAALREAGGLRHPPGARDVRYSMVLGRFSDFDRGLSDEPAWVLTMTCVCISEGHGPPPGAVPRPAHHEGDLVVDARTGKYIESFGQ